ncbi:MAG: c-type cytochrome [Nitrosomonadales bacterium]|nr:c-type cytochrome [Nitrosomonadales bacterium]
MNTQLSRFPLCGRCDLIEQFFRERIVIFRLHYKFVTCLAAIALLAAPHAYAGTDAIKQRIGTGNPVAGKSKSSLCQSCHGQLGLSLEELIPHLAGQYSRYIEKQLHNFQSGARKSPIMGTIAATLNDKDMDDIAAYFASQDKMQGGGWGNNSAAKNLFLKGDTSRNIQACASCHGVDGKGKAPDIATFPVIGGQHRAYLHAQMMNWRKGERTNSPNGVMNRIAKALTIQEIDALTDYISGL